MGSQEGEKKDVTRTSRTSSASRAKNSIPEMGKTSEERKTTLVEKDRGKERESHWMRSKRFSRKRKKEKGGYRNKRPRVKLPNASRKERIIPSSACHRHNDFLAQGEE